MKRKICVALLFFVTASCFGQTVCPKHIETPAYPPAAAVARVQGKVTLRITLDAEGNVTKAEVANDLAHPTQQMLQESAIDNMTHWTFEKPSSAPFTLVFIYEYKMDGSLPVNSHQNPMTKVNIDLPDHVTILHNETAWNPAQQKKKPKSSAP